MNKIIHDEYLHGNIVCIRPKTGYLKESDRMSMYLYLGLPRHEQEQEQDFMHWLGHGLHNPVGG